MPRMPACFTVSARAAGLAAWLAWVAALSSMGAFSPDMSAVLPVCRSLAAALHGVAPNRSDRMSVPLGLGAGDDGGVSFVRGNIQNVHGGQGVFGEDVPQQFGIGCAERAVGDDEQVHGAFCKVLSGHCKRFQAA